MFSQLLFLSPLARLPLYTVAFALLDQADLLSFTMHAYATTIEG